MAAEEKPRRTWNINPNASPLLVLLALICFVFALCVAEAWFTKGTWQEWIAGGLICSTAAKLV